MTDEIYMEIVETEEGKVVLRRSEEDATPLMQIEFSKEVLGDIPDDYADIARIMMAAGLQSINAIHVRKLEEEAPVEHIIH